MDCDKVFCPAYEIKIDGCNYDPCSMDKERKECPFCKSQIKDFETICEDCEYDETVK